MHMGSQTSKSLALLQTLVDEFLMLVSESAGFHDRVSDVKMVLREALDAALTIRRRVDASRREFIVAVVGQANVGKSTLLAALLGEDLCPRRNGPCTAAPIEFSWGPVYRIEAHYRRTFRRPVWSCLNAADVLQHLVRLADAAECDASEPPARIRVQVPLSLLETGLVIADTPGFGAAQSGYAVKDFRQQTISLYS